MTSTFELLMDQIGMSLDSRRSSAFLHAEIEEVIVHKISRVWDFHFLFSEILPIEIFRELKVCLANEFSKTGNSAVFTIRVRKAACSDVLNELIQSYYPEVFEVGPCSVQSFRSLYQKLKVRIQGDKLLIERPRTIDIKHFREHYLLQMSTQLAKFGFPFLNCQVVHNHELTETQIQYFQRESKKIMQTANDKETSNSREVEKKSQKGQMVEERSTVSNVQTKKETGLKNSRLDEGEVRPMSSIQTEENRVTFEGVVFYVEHRTTRTGRVLINFKMTDYTSSFSVQKWVKNNEEFRKFDMIKKNSWLRVCGNIGMNQFTRNLTMSAQDIQEIVHYRRKDLMPKGEKRIEFHAHTNMSTMDALPEVEQLIDTAYRWGHPAIAITDHANVQSFPKAYKVSKKLGMKIIYGMEANIVEDHVPIVYNEAHLNLNEAIYVVFDIETTGLSAIYNDLIQVAAVKMHKGNVISEFNEFINPGYALPSFITDLTGITDDHVYNSKPIKKVLKEFQDFCQDSILVAHNAVFDVGFLNINYERHSLPKINQPVIDTLELARNLYPENKRHGLGALTKRFRISLKHHHMANYDAEATAYLFVIFLNDVITKYDVHDLQDINIHVVGTDSYKRARIKHATVYVKNQIGLKNIFKLVSLSHTKYFAGVPRIPRSVLDAHRDGLLIGTSGDGGEVFDVVVSQGLDAAVQVAQYYDFIEVMPPTTYSHLVAYRKIKNKTEIQKTIKDLVEVGYRLQKPVIATGNVHYIEPEEEIYREIIVRSLGKGAVINRIGRGEDEKPIPLPKMHFRTTNEMLDEFAFLGENEARRLVIKTPCELLSHFEPIEVLKDNLYTPYIKDAEEEVARLTYERAFSIYGNPLPELVDLRIEKELTSILGNGFSVIYLASQMLVKRSNNRGYLVGSRGSVGSSFVATMIGITEVNPLCPHYYCPNCQYSEFITDGSFGSGFDMPDKTCPDCSHDLGKDGQDIPFETFLGFDGDKVPDIDLNFSGDDQSRAHLDVREIFGAAYVFRSGTIGTVATKTAYGFVKGYERDYGKFYRDAEIDRLVQGTTGVKRTTGQHPGGIVVIPNYMDVYDFTPVQYPADDLKAEWMTTHFTFHDIDENVLKLDILAHDDPTMIRKLQDLSGVDPQDIPANDPKVMQLFSGTEVLGVTEKQIGTSTGVLGIPEFGTNFVRGMVSETHPTTFSELLQLSGLSHGTDVWLGNAKDLIRNGIANLSTVISCRDDIMVYLMHKGLNPKMAFTIMERVRKGAWLSIPDEERNVYVAAMRKHHVPEWYIESCEKIKYVFPKAHAVAYVIMALRVAYFKVYHPICYYCAYFSIRAKSFDIKIMGATLDAVKERMREIAEKRKINEASNAELDLYTTLEIVNEMLERGFQFGGIDLYRSHATEFLIDGDRLIPPFSSVDGLGENVARQIVEERKKGAFLSKMELRKRSGLSGTLVEKMEDLGILNHMPEDNQLSLFDDFL